MISIDMMLLADDDDDDDYSDNDDNTYSIFTDSWLSARSTTR